MERASPILVIGGTRGTGLLIARLLDRTGHRVRVMARNPQRAATVLPATVEVVPGDLTKPESVLSAIDGASDIVFTAGCRSGIPVGEAQVRATEYHGVLNTIASAERLEFGGRFLYMTSSGVGQRSLTTILLNLYKGNTLEWRWRAEDAIRASTIDYTIIRTGVLLNRPSTMRAVEVTQKPLPLTIRNRIGRADVAEAFVAALGHPRTIRTTFEIVWRPGYRSATWATLFDGLRSDAELSAAGAA